MYLLLWVTNGAKFNDQDWPRQARGFFFFKFRPLSNFATIVRKLDKFGFEGFCL